jgi:RNA polymerase sigma factor (sigma-70 family)
MIEDAELLRDYAGSSSEQAFAELVRRHLGLVYRVALRKVGGDTHLAEDVAQGVFTDLARKAGVLSRRQVLTGWLFTSAHFAATKAVRTAIRRRHREQKAQLMHELSSDPTPAMDWDRLRPAIDDLIQTLPESDREAVLLRYFEGRDFEQIGATLHLTPNGARSRVERALDKIRAALARRGITSTAAALATALEAQGLLAAPAGLAPVVTSAALAGAAGGSLVAGLVFLMNKTLVASAVALLAIGFAVYQANQISRAEIALAEISKDRDRLQAQLREEQRYVAEADRQAAALKRSLSASFSSTSGSAAPATVSSIAAKPAPAPQGQGKFTFIKKDPGISDEEFQQQIRAKNGRAIDGTYAALYQRLGFTPAQQEQFRTLILDSNERTAALFKAAAAQRSRLHAGLVRVNSCPGRRAAASEPGRRLWHRDGAGGPTLSGHHAGADDRGDPARERLILHRHSAHSAAGGAIGGGRGQFRPQSARQGRSDGDEQRGHACPSAGDPIRATARRLATVGGKPASTPARQLKIPGASPGAFSQTTANS